jgi:hypothetical protein
MSITRRGFLATGAAGFGLALLPRFALAADCRTPPLGRIVYRVLRKGSPLGEHVASFERRGEDLVVRNDIELVARIFGIPVYRYEHSNEEIWRGGVLQAVTSKTNKDGKKFDLSGERRDGVLHVSGRKGDLALEGEVLTTSLWHPDTPFAAQLLDIEDGHMKQIEGLRKDREAVPIPQGRTTARHFRLTGDMERDLWYDDACRLLRVEFNTKKDGSRITLEPTAVEA